MFISQHCNSVSQAVELHSRWDHACLLEGCVLDLTVSYMVRWQHSSLLTNLSNLLNSLFRNLFLHSNYYLIYLLINRHTLGPMKCSFVDLSLLCSVVLCSFVDYEFVLFHSAVEFLILSEGVDSFSVMQLQIAGFD